MDKSPSWMNDTQGKKRTKAWPRRGTDNLESPVPPTTGVVKQQAVSLTKSHHNTGHRKVKPKALVAIIVLVTAAVFVRHPKSAPIIVDFLSPAEKFLTELDRWGNFTVTSTIRSVIQDVFNASSSRVEPELPFYIDIIAGAANSTVRRPVLFVPGYITSGMEIWANLPCAKARFRERIWGTANMVKLFITDPKCWVHHMLLSPIYGQEINGSQSVHFMDPVGVKIKPTSGLAAADFVIGDYWVWNPIIEALGYVQGPLLHAAGARD